MMKLFIFLLLMTITPLLIAQVLITLIFLMAIMPKLAGKQMAKDMFRTL